MRESEHFPDAETCQFGMEELADFRSICESVCVYAGAECRANDNTASVS